MPCWKVVMWNVYQITTHKITTSLTLRFKTLKMLQPVKRLQVHAEARRLKTARIRREWFFLKGFVLLRKVLWANSYLQWKVWENFAKWETLTLLTFWSKSFPIILPCSTSIFYTHITGQSFVFKQQQDRLQSGTETSKNTKSNSNRFVNMNRVWHIHRQQTDWDLDPAEIENTVSPARFYTRAVVTASVQTRLWLGFLSHRALPLLWTAYWDIWQNTSFLKKCYILMSPWV